MAIKKIIPTDKESPLQISEVFFSQTDSKGVILNGNEVFFRVSGYSHEYLQGKPHNIVRHPDMPRSVFKLFWDTLISGEPIVAYVKNLAADGSYYWVLAAAFPDANGYVSIRIKPSSSLFDRVKTLYAEALRYESTHSLEESLAFLLGQLKAMGFVDYRSFAVHAMNLELDQRAQTVKRPLSDAQSKEGLCQSALNSYDRVKDDIESILRLKATLIEHNQSIVSRYREVKYVALNMITQVDKLGEEARTLHVVAETFRVWAEQIYRSVETTSESVNKVLDILERSGFQVSSSRFHLELLAFYSHELKEKSLDAHSLIPFVHLANEAMGNSHQRVSSVLKCVQDVGPMIVELREALRALYIVRQNGLIEIAQLRGGGAVFLDQITQMGDFIKSVGGAASQLEEILREIEKKLETIAGNVSKTQLFLGTIR